MSLEEELPKREYITLLSIKIEIADYYEPLTHLHYTVPQKLTTVEPIQFAGLLEEEIVHKYWGARKLEKIEIDSYDFDGMSDEINLNQDEGENPKEDDADDTVPPNDDDDDDDDKVEQQLKSTEETSNLSWQTIQRKDQSRGARRQLGLSPVPFNKTDTRFYPIGNTSASPVALYDDEPPTPSSRPGSGRLRPKSHSPKHPAMIPFFSGNQSSDLTEGILHLFKDGQPTVFDSDTPRSKMICILAVPAGINTHDLLGFMAPVYPGIKMMRIIRDSTPNQYMVLLTFREQSQADEFYRNFNGIQFNSIESNTCHLVYISKVETIKVSEGGCLPDKDQIELPKCPVCLERMDESVDGILMTQCNHSFHGYCLSKWGDTSCPVCRYIQTPELVDDNQCFVCAATESLWICLICGNIGCGRYSNTHAHEHFQETQHTYAMDIGSNLVWDYAGDNFVHRLIQTKGDGKPVQYTDEGGNLVNDEKIDNVALEYTYFFTQQLEYQRKYFTEQIARIELETQNQIEDLESRSKTTHENYLKSQTKLDNTVKEKQAVEKKCAQLNSRVHKLDLSLRDEGEMNKCLRENQKAWQDKVDNLTKIVQKRDQDIEDLQEQVRDIMFYMEAKDKLVNCNEVSAEELQQGQIVVTPESSGRSKRTIRKKPAR